ncbi:HlyD family secretion protein [Paludisphaera rhizosphaerae]|uniref:HlyD family secretion protein n=1 Tax=Paludisphaera rhizosphaerae TaxID=2711216 RepID=UPI0013EAA4BD|nr:HlyD family efflux transporter periplasmic adaptor subunit [Paludisphaera rhizosphaerae]
MLTRRIIPILAIAGVVYSIVSTVMGAKSPEPSKPVIQPHPRPAKERMLAGSGLVESRRENIPIGASIPGVVIQVHVKKGDHVKQGDPLFLVDDREVRGQIGVKQAQLESACAQLHKLQAAPRPEDLPPLEAAVEEAQAKLDDAETALGRTRQLFSRQAVPSSDLDKDKFAYYAAKASLDRAIAELERVKKGSWQEDVDVSKVAVKLAQSELDSCKLLLDRHTVRAPIDGDVLQLNVRPGQFAATNWNEPMIVLGDVNRLHVRVDIDENDVPLFDHASMAAAYLKGRSHGRLALKFEYVEPYMIPKQSLTGATSERVDTRVLRVVYSLPDGCQDRVYVGQQMDVYIKVPKDRWDAAFDAVGRPEDPFGDAPKPTPAPAVPATEKVGG